eukprot:Seg376.10 transcript_id=Seg376.10/GoldUCD/mRNA.D3Y31 product="hypothetical protein" protein_id=Seg376.10/GoldUCD/D3Y31
MTEKIQKLQFISSAEADKTIIFPRLKRRLLQVNDETAGTFSLPQENDMLESFHLAKQDAIEICNDCQIYLESYDDTDLLIRMDEIVTHGVENDDEENASQAEDNVSQNELSREETITIQEDLSLVRLRKSKSSTFTCYEPLGDGVEVNRYEKTYAQEKNRKEKRGKEHRSLPLSPFVLYNGVYIKKSTALYILQENLPVSSDRLLRVRSEQPSHIFTGLDINHCGPQQSVRSGDLCIFKRMDSKTKCLVGRIVQFSYLQGTKRERQYSSDNVDLSKTSYKNIGVCSNWYQGTKVGQNNATGVVNFKPLDQVFTPGYLSLEYYVTSIDDKALIDSEYSFSISEEALTKALPRWRVLMTFDMN